MKILIVDDHPVVRQGLKRILAEISDPVVVDEASNGRGALTKAREGNYDMVLLDISMPDMNGLDVLRELKREKPTLPVLILSIHPEEQYAIRALKAGASGYITKDNASDELISAIEKVSSAGKYISPSLADRLAYDLEADATRPPHEILSDREYQVMRLIASGKAVREIAEKLSLSVKTINTYRSRIRQKMKMKTNAELICYAIKNQLFE